MPFSVKIFYLLHEYTYLVSTEDERHFVCTRQEVVEGDEVMAPPEKILMILDEEPKPEVWGKSLAALYRDLVEKITEYITNESHK